MLKATDADAYAKANTTDKPTKKDGENLNHTLSERASSKPIKFPHHCPMCNYHGRSLGGLTWHFMYHHRKHEVVKCLIATLAKLELCIESSNLFHLEE